MERTKRKSNEKVDSVEAAKKRHAELLEAVKSLETSLSQLRDASLASLNDRITYLIGVYLGRGSVTVHEHRNLLSIYQAYKNIGGNGAVAALVDGFTKLPIK